MPPKKKGLQVQKLHSVLTDKEKEVNDELHKIILSRYNSSLQKDNINVAILWVGYRGLSRWPCLNGEMKTPYQTFLRGQWEMEPNLMDKQIQKRNDFREMMKQLLVFLQDFFPFVLCEVIKGYVRAPRLPFVCELRNSIWQDKCLMDELRYLSTIIVHKSDSDAQGQLQEDFIQCLKDDNPNLDIDIYHLICTPLKRVALKSAKLRAPPQFHACRSCTNMRLCPIKCLCPYRNYCSLECLDRSK